MASKIQTMRAGGLQHPEEIMNFFGSQITSNSGVINAIDGALEVSENTVPDMSVLVNEGSAFLKLNSTVDMAYPVRVYDGDYQVTISSNSTGNSRIDSIVLYVDKGASPNSDITNVAKLTAVEGTAAASPVAPSSSDIQTAIGSASYPYIVIADVTVASGATSIVDANITDQRDEVTYLFSASAVINGNDGFGDSYQISTSIATDDLTVSIEDMDGNTPAVGGDVKFRVGNEKFNLYQALSVTVDDSADHFGWDTGKIQGNIGQLFVFAINNNGTLQVGVSPDPTLTTVATNYYDAGGQTGSAGHTNIVMSGTRNATNSCRVIGRINVHQEDDNDWITPATEKIINSPIFETDVLEFDTVWTGITLGNSTNNCWYQLDGKKVKSTILYTQGSTGSVTGSLFFTFPILADSNVYTAFTSILGSAYVKTGVYTGVVLYYSASQGIPYAVVANQTYANIGGSQMSNTVPSSWSTSDTLGINFEYFIA